MVVALLQPPPEVGSGRMSFPHCQHGVLQNDRAHLDASANIAAITRSAHFESVVQTMWVLWTVLLLYACELMPRSSYGFQQAIQKVGLWLNWWGRCPDAVIRFLRHVRMLA